MANSSNKRCDVSTATGTYSCLRVDLVFARELSFYIVTIFEESGSSVDKHLASLTVSAFRLFISFLEMNRWPDRSGYVFRSGLIA